MHSTTGRRRLAQIWLADVCDPVETHVIPAKAGIQSVGSSFPNVRRVDSRFRGNDLRLAASVARTCFAGAWLFVVDGGRTEESKTRDAGHGERDTELGAELPPTCYGLPISDDHPRHIGPYGCTTKMWWNSCNLPPIGSLLPEALEPTAEFAAAQGDDGVGTTDRPVHATSF